MKTAITVPGCIQTGMDTWKDVYTTKVFDESATLKEVLDWAKTIDKKATLSSVQISSVIE